MPQRLEPSERVLLIVALGMLLGVATLAVLLAPAREEAADADMASSYRNGPGGARATWLLLGELGYPVERWERAPAQLPHDQRAARTLLVLAEPSVASTDEESLAVARFVAAGGTLLVAGDADSLVPGLRTARLAAFGDSAVECERALLTPITERAPTIELRRLAVDVAIAPGATVLYRHGGSPVVVSYRHGAGEVIWWAGTTPLTNRGLDDRRHLALLFDTLGPPGERRVLWDEYFHDVRGSLSAYLARTPLPWILAQLLALFALVCVTWARRFGPVRVPIEESRVSMLEFVDAVGGLYARAGAAATAVRLAHDALRVRLAARLGLAPSTPPVALAAAAQRRLGAGGPPLAAALQRAERMQDDQPHALAALALVQELDRWDRRLHPVEHGAGGFITGRGTT